MQKSIKITVIVPVYNVENYLQRCVDSLLAQTLQDIEIILVNDGSTDNSLQIIQKYSQQQSNIFCIDKENGGLSDARNAGIKSAKGEYLAFVDSDDWIEAEMLQEMYSLAKKHSAEICICGLQKVDENGKIIKTLPQLPQLPEKIDLEKDFSIFGEMSCFACNKIFKKELFEGVEFIKGIHFEDIATIPVLFLKSKIIAKTDKLFYQYFERSGSITKNFTDKGLDIFKAIENVKNKFNKSSFKNNKQNWKKFVILQGYYSFLAYYAYVKDAKLKKQMKNKLKTLVEEEKISKKDILMYQRFGKNYLLSLSPIKIIYYLLQTMIL